MKLKKALSVLSVLATMLVGSASADITQAFDRTRIGLSNFDPQVPIELVSLKQVSVSDAIVQSPQLELAKNRYYGTMYAQRTVSATGYILSFTKSFLPDKSVIAMNGSSGLLVANNIPLTVVVTGVEILKPG